MVPTGIHATLQHHPLGARRALACVLVLALVWAQSLGLWHSVVHADVLPGGRAGVTQLAALDSGQPPSLMQRLFAGHQYDTDCQFFDQHSHGDALAGAGAAMAPLALPTTALVASHALAVARWLALFQARGPPSVR